MKKVTSFAITALLTGAFTACQQTTSDGTAGQQDSNTPVVEKSTLRAGVELPFEQVKSKINTFKLNASLADTLMLENGTTIYIPENVFVNSKNQPVTGEIQLDYTEFHNAAEIIISGIPMRWDSAGTPIDFQTAGMMEIRAYQDNKELAIAHGKAITVDLASNVAGNDYGAYYFDEAANNWACLKASPVKENIYKKIELQNLEKEAKTFTLIKPEAYNPEVYTFDLDINYSRFPELKDLHGIMWQYAGKSAKDDPRNLADFKMKSWVNIQIDRTTSTENEFQLTLVDSKKTTFKTTVKPVLRGKMLEIAQKEFQGKFDSYQKKLEIKKAEIQRLAKQAELFRTFQVSNMGIYNYDRQLKLADRVELFADFNFDTQTDADFNNIQVFLITGDEKAVVHYPKSDWGLFAFSPSSDNKLLAVLPNDKIAIYSQKDFNSVDLKQFKKGERSKFTFKMKTQDIAIKSPEQLNSVLVKF